MKLILLSLLFVLVSCGHHRDVRPGVNGVHRVVVRGEYKQTAEEEAMRQAAHYCDEFEKRAAYMSERSYYSGDVDEQTYKTGKMLTRVVRNAGNNAWVQGGKKERNQGQILSGGANSLDDGLGEGYTTEMTFKCM